MTRSRLTHVQSAGIVRIVALLVLMFGSLGGWQQQAQAAGTAQVVITSLADDGSTPLPFARFQVLDADGNVLATRESEPVTGIATIDFELGDADQTYSVSMETPPACAEQPADQQLGTIEDGDVIDLTFQTSFLADCNLGSISAYAYVCPDGFESTSTDYATYQQGCTETTDDLTFTITQQDGDQQQFSMTTGAYGIPGRAPLVGLLPGDYELASADGDANALLVFCSTYDGTPLESTDPSSVDQEPVNDDAGVDLTLGNRQRIACDFFAFNSQVNQPDDSDTNGDNSGAEGNDDNSDNGTDAAADTASIEFHVATCPSGYDGSDFYNDCAGNGTEGVTFTVEGQNSGHTDTATSSVPTTPGFGIAVVADLPADTYLMSEEIPGDFVSLFVYCAEAPGGGDRLPTTETGTQTYSLDVAEGQAIICDWYVIPDQQVETAVLRLTDFTCPAGFAGTTFADVTGTCVDITTDVTFNLSNGSGFAVDKTTNSDGKVRWTDLAPGDDYVLRSDLPGDALDRQIAYCATDGGDYIEYGVSGDGSIDLDPISDGQQVQCLWYQVPTNQLSGAGSIELHKFECPPGTSGNYYQTCHNSPLGGIDFELDGPRGLIQNGTTADDGLLLFQDLPKGDYVLTEDGADYPVEIYVVVCTQNGNAFSTTYDDSTGLRVKFNLPENANIVCDWYNIPKGNPTTTPGQGSGSVTVVLRACVKPASEIENFTTECSAYGAGVSFTLTSVKSGGTTQTIKTDTNSKALFSGLADGTYRLDQVNGDWCKAQADRVDANGNVIVENGGNTNVYVYDCNVQGVDTLPATGSGPDSTPSWPWIWLTTVIGAAGAGLFIARRALV